MQEYNQQTNEDDDVVHHDLYLSRPQMRAILADPKELYLHTGRRTGKTTEVISHLTANRVEDMPKAAFLMMGRTYKQVLTRTLPGTIQGWAKRGYIEDIHYVIGKRPPSDWPKAFGAPVDFKHYISFYTGTGFHIGSQDRPGLVNSLTVWGIFGDESKLLLEDRFKEDAMPTNSGPLHYFPDNPHNRCIVLTSSMPPMPDGKWLVDMEKRMDKKQIETIIRIAHTIEVLKEELLRKPEHHARLTRKITGLTKFLNKLRKNSVMYEEASTFANVHVLGLDYLKQERSVLKNFFKTEILSLRQDAPEGGFYANMSTKNFYTDFNYTHYDRYSHKNIQSNSLGDNDCVKSQPLIIGMDFGPNFNCIVTGQRFDGQHKLKYINAHWAGLKKIVDDVVEDWCDYYEYHPTKEVIFHHDKTGNNKTGLEKDTYAERVMRILRRRGWNVDQKTIGGANPRHLQKYLLWNLALPGNDHKFPTIQINQDNCEQLKVSMENSLVVEKQGMVSKDKSIERRASVPPEDATHLSDAADTIILGEYEHLLREIDVHHPGILIR